VHKDNNTIIMCIYIMPYVQNMIPLRGA